MFAYCRNNPVCRVDISGQADISAVEEAFDDDVDVGPTDKELGGGGTSGVEVVLFRAASPIEVNNALQTQQFETCATGYTFGKFFATTYADAVQWGDTMYPDGNYKIMQATFDSQILAAPGTAYYSSLDSIGPAYFIEIGDLNYYVKYIQ